jgi:hypothetical protein
LAHRTRDQRIADELPVTPPPGRRHAELFYLLDFPIQPIKGITPPRSQYVRL